MIYTLAIIAGMVGSFVIGWVCGREKERTDNEIREMYKNRHD